MAKYASLGPVVVGGVGGSGTRLIAEMLINMGFYMGTDLNVFKDNLTFTLLLKRPLWHKSRKPDQDSSVFTGLSTFESIMQGTFPRSAAELFFIVNATFDMFRNGHQMNSDSGRGRWAFKRAVKAILSRRIDPASYRGWGWKEPNSWLYLEQMNQFFGELKYIHVIRHGLDMAYSSNQNQFHNWSSLFDIRVPESPELMPTAFLDYWIKANQAAIQQGTQLLQERFLLLIFDEMCLHPRTTLETLIEFLSVEVDQAEICKLSKLIKVPKSIGRYKDHNMDIFSKEEIKAVRELGFEI